MRARQAKQHDDPQWQGWRWKPDSVAGYAGAFRGEALPVTAQVTDGDEGLQLRIGALKRRLMPAAMDLFAAQDGPLDVPESLQFQRGAQGELLGFEFDGQRYVRAEPK